MSIPPRFLDDIRNRLTLSEIIGRRITVKRAGRESKACCPFHKESTPSFTINDDKQFYHCFGCGAHGDVINFVMQHDNISFIDTVEMLSAEAGLQMPKPDPQAAKKAEQQRGLHDLMDEATQWMQSAIEDHANRDILDYIEQRGMDEKIRAGFRIGYAPADGQALRKAMLAKGFSDAQMLEVNILKKSTKGGAPYVFFRDRVMFPVLDRRGRVVAFGGRILPEHIRPNNNPNFTPPKYINSSDTPLFDKGRMLYAESFARQAAREGHTILVVEGYMDVIACHKAGFKGAVAPMGTSLTEEQIISLWQMIPEGEKTPVLCFDGDRAGREAAGRAAQRILPLLGPDQSARIAFIPDGEDPDSILRTQGREAFRSVLQSSLTLFDFLWVSHSSGRAVETPEQRAGFEKSLMDDVAKIKDVTIQRYYRERVKSKISDIFFSNNRKRPYGGGQGKGGYGGGYGGGAGQNKPRLMSPAVKLRKPAAQNRDDVKHRILFAALVNHPQIYQWVEEAFGGMTIHNMALQRLRGVMVEALEAEQDHASGQVSERASEQALDAQALQHHLIEQGFEKEIRDIVCESVYVHAAFCRPKSEQEYDAHEIAREWLVVHETINAGAMDAEIRDGWREVINAGDEEGIAKLSQVIAGRGKQRLGHDE